ncbi:MULTISPECIES: efflux RND transporter periplasmic adaptor subunit [unclassified Meridianimarinicoccus]|uniref:efflux RND transporter periplasmic adaptor subunit n=1 Tax=unclassified Meridianimarinicoccus TaxID=2923344 RepID=UPI001867B1DE|nr:efflux RND transporter periplasmic adaptor subunit [Fluviibacterium sp. MJW13]
MPFPPYSGLRISALSLALLAAPMTLAQDAGSGQPAPKVSVAAAVTEEILDDITFIGRAEAVDKVDLVARVTGFIREVNVANGATVSEGDILFHIEPEQYEATLAARQADLAQANANLALAQVEFDRKSQLVEKEAVAQSELDVARANRQVAEAQIAAAEAAIKQAELELSYTLIVAPFDGAIGRTERSVGDLVGPTTGTLATLVRQEPMYVTFSLSERQMIDVRQQAQADDATNEDVGDGYPVYVTLPGGTVLDEVGRLAFRDNRVNPSTGTIAVRAIFDNADHLLVDGSFVNVDITAQEPTPSLTVPQAAVQRDQRGEFVLVVTNQQIVEQRYIETGPNHETSVIVTRGLQEGEAVIVEGLQRVRPGVPVDPVLTGTEE